MVPTTLSPTTRQFPAVCPRELRPEPRPVRRRFSEVRPDAELVLAMVRFAACAPYSLVSMDRVK
jgi:hypothetical protein